MASPDKTPPTALHEAYEAITRNDDFDGSHVSLDRDSKGEEYVQIDPDWLEAPALRFLCDLSRDQELALALTKEGLRLDEHSGETVRGVQAVKDVLAGRGEEDDEVG